MRRRIAQVLFTSLCLATASFGAAPDQVLTAPGVEGVPAVPACPAEPVEPAKVVIVEPCDPEPVVAPVVVLEAPKQGEPLPTAKELFERDRAKLEQERAKAEREKVLTEQTVYGLAQVSEAVKAAATRVITITTIQFGTSTIVIVTEGTEPLRIRGVRGVDGKISGFEFTPRPMAAFSGKAGAKWTAKAAPKCAQGQYSVGFSPTLKPAKGDAGTKKDGQLAKSDPASTISAATKGATLLGGLNP